MKKIILLLSLISSFIFGQGPVFKQFDIIVYPEYYFSGIMVELNGTVADITQPVELEITVPANTDSVFYVAGVPENEAEVTSLTVLTENGRNFIRLNIRDESFRAFIFYEIDKNGHERSGSFTFQANIFLEDAHLIIQEPVMAENFDISADGAEPFDDQHGMTFYRLHLHDLQPNAQSTISFSYINHTEQTSIQQLQQMLSGNSALPNSAPKKERPIRHTLPLWQPITVLGVLAVSMGVIFMVQKKRDNAHPSSGNQYCTSCGKQVDPNNKFCSSCGGKL